MPLRLALQLLLDERFQVSDFFVALGQRGLVQLLFVGSKGVLIDYVLVGISTSTEVIEDVLLIQRGDVIHADAEDLGGLFELLIGHAPTVGFQAAIVLLRHTQLLGHVLLGEVLEYNSNQNCSNSKA